MEKPKIVPNDKGTLVTLKFKIKAQPDPEVQWFKGANLIQNSAKYQEKFQTSEKVNHDVALEIKNPDGNDGGDALITCTPSNMKLVRRRDEPLARFSRRNPSMTLVNSIQS